MTTKVGKTFIAAIFIAGIGAGAFFTSNPDLNPVTAAIPNAEAKSADEISPVKAQMSDSVYYPGTEDLDPDEMRIIALGTGMPWPRGSQAGPGFLVELGNGDKFIFDMGEGTVDNLVTLQIPWEYLDKVFIGHLHGDHFGDLGALFIGGGLGGRTGPVRVWGPNGPTPELGTAYALEHLAKAFTWDKASRQGYVDVRGFEFETHEFDYKKVNAVIYEENGVVVRSIPAIHALEGPVSFILEWNDLKFVFSSDTAPNTWFDEYARDADLVIHESFIPAIDVVNGLKADPESALFAGTQAHTAPQAFGKIMSRLKPKLAVAYHFFYDNSTVVNILDSIRQSYTGPLSLAKDYMVWNVKKDGIRQRMVVADQDNWTPEKPVPGIAPLQSDRDAFAASIGIKTSDLDFSQDTLNHRLDVDDVVEPIYIEFEKIFGRKFNYPDPRTKPEDK
ncbi:MAG: MBL fold metallo-hydrolase [Colwellia sp.]|nr:MBL fold metallo-hydrolase [Colwellia sp.]